MTANTSTLLRQRGNTLTGIIIGLIVGLAIAVAVALAITKGASPFTDKAAKTGRPADPEPSAATDPNKPMYGNRDAAREANKELAERAAPAAKGNAAADADPLGAAIAGMEKPAGPPAEVHPLAVPQSAQPAGGGDGYIYYLQAGAFRDMADAESAKAKLALLGFEATISDRTSDSGVLHRVRMGPFNQVEAMNKARAKLQDSGVDVAIVRNQK